MEGGRGEREWNPILSTCGLITCVSITTVINAMWLAASVDAQSISVTAAMACVQLCAVTALYVGWSYAFLLIYARISDVYGVHARFFIVYLCLLLIIIPEGQLEY